MLNQVVDEAVSTNDLARELGHAGAPSGSWISARIQTGGRGRLGRTWKSQRGNLFLSMIVRGIPVSRASWIPLAAGVGAARAVEQALPLMQIRLKWPNDVRIGARKLGGILCEGKEDFYIVGIGINCASTPQGLDQPATSLTAAAGRPIDADDFRPRLITGLRGVFEDLARLGAAPIAEEYMSRASFAPGDSVRWSDQRGSVLGLGEYGELRVQTSAGPQGLFAEDVESVRPL